MDRVNGTDWIDIGGGKRGFRSQNAGAGIPGTEVTDDFLNAVQEEILKVVEAVGLVPDGADLTQLWQALNILARPKRWAVAAGTGNAITTTLTPPLTSYSAGLVIALEITNDNTDAVTLDIDGLGAKSVRNVSQNLLLGAGALKDNHVAFLVYDGGKFVCLNPIATDIGRGLVELATAGEATAGADTERAVTPSAAMALLASRMRGAVNTNPVPADGWNDATAWGIYPVLLEGSAPHGPGGAVELFHPLNLWYGSNDQNITQIAIPYADATSIKRGLLMRRRYQGVWDDVWRPVVQVATQQEVDDGVGNGVVIASALYHKETKMLIATANQVVNTATVNTLVDPWSIEINTFQDSTIANGVITVGEKDAGVWDFIATAQAFNVTGWVVAVWVHDIANDVYYGGPGHIPNGMGFTSGTISAVTRSVAAGDQFRIICAANGNTTMPIYFSMARRNG